MRFFICGAALLALSACDTTVPDSGAGVGFGDYDTYQQQQAARDAQLRGNAVPPAGAISDERSAPAASGGTPAPEGEAEQLAAQTAAALNSGEEPLQASPSNPPPAAVNASGISQENDFSNVSSLRTIEGDAARIAQNRAQYTVIEPTALPTRRGGTGPNIVDYALNTNNPKGAPLYRRSSLGGQARFNRNCAKYPSPDMAQADFLSKGGPDRDRLGLDPDGDGFACAWDPAPFRKVRSE